MTLEACKKSGRIGIDVVDKVAEIARLKLTERERKAFSKEFTSILEWFAGIDVVNTKGVEPSWQPVPISNITRDDVEEKSLSQQDALANTKHRERGFFKGPRAV
jgi:aspartyl-tRNA(Asn)/glutamyl-tRNA(Gln) amidotransferase subunit C